MAPRSTVKTDELPLDNEAELEPINDDAVPPVTGDPEPPAPAADAGDDDDAEPVAPPPNPREAKLKEIAERRKKERMGEEAPEFTGDMADPTQTVGTIAMPKMDPAFLPEMVRPAADQAPAADKPAEPAAPPKKITLKVDHELIESDIARVAELADMTIEEVEAQPERATRYAQRELAAQRRLDRASAILRGAKERPQDENRPHQGDDDPDLPNPEPEGANHSDLKQLVEDLQFGADPQEIATRLDGILTKKSADMATNQVLQVKVNEHLQSTLKAYEKIKGANPELFKDPNNEAVMERMLTDGYREDLRQIGVPEDRIPRNSKELADWHRLYAVQGRKVRDPEKLLNDVKDSFVKWRGGTPNTNAQPAPRRGTVVNVDRSERRQAIPTQPPRASAPQSVPNPPAQKTSRSAALDKMRKARGQPTAA